MSRFLTIPMNSMAPPAHSVVFVLSSVSKAKKYNRKQKRGTNDATDEQASIDVEGADDD